MFDTIRFPGEGHRTALEIVMREADAAPDVCGVLLCGSVARGDALPGSDLDIRLILRDDAPKRAFDAREIAGVWVEQTARTQDKAHARLWERPQEVYPYLEGVILRDDTGALGGLTQQARTLYDNYRSPDSDRNEWRYWLQSTQRKLQAAHASHVWEKCGYLIATSSWPLLCGLWVAANRPVPPGGAIIPFLPDACTCIPGLPVETVMTVFSGATVEDRTEAFLSILHHILPLLESEAQSEEA